MATFKIEILGGFPGKIRNLDGSDYLKPLNYLTYNHMLTFRKNARLLKEGFYNFLYIHCS